MMLKSFGMIKSALSNLLILLIFFSCSKVEKQEWKGFGKINMSGTYFTIKGNYNIVVNTKSNIVSYKVYDSNNNIIIDSQRKISSLQHWFIYWDDNNGVLWVYSSDIGSSYWFSSEKGHYIEIIITGSTKNDIPFKIPNEIKNKIVE